MSGFGFKYDADALNLWKCVAEVYKERGGRLRDGCISSTAEMILEPDETYSYIGRTVRDIRDV